MSYQPIRTARITHDSKHRPSGSAKTHLALLAAALSVLFATFITGCATPGATPAPAANTAALEPAVLPAETFDAAWTTIRDEHFDPSLNGVDWDAVRDDLRPRAVAAESTAELRAVLGEMLSRLGQSHFAIIPAASDGATGDATGEDDSGGPSTESPTTETPTTDARSIGDPSTTPHATGAGAPASPGDATGPGISGIDIALIEGEPTVLRVAPDLPGAAAGVLTGWQLVSVDGTSVAALLAPLRDALANEQDPNSPRARQLRASLAFTGGELLNGLAGQELDAVFADARGVEQRVRIALAPAPLGTTKFGNLPAFPVEVDSRIVELPVGDDAPGGPRPVRIGVLSFNIWMTGASDAIDQAVDSMRGCDGIVLDLRGNPGGMGAMSMGVAGHFLREPLSLGSMLGRDSTLEFRASPRKVSASGKRVRPYSTRPLAILLDGRSASTSEVFAGGLQDLGRARVFGETSAGMALPAQAKRLPNGDVLLHAVADFVTPSGARLEGRGVVPDEPVTANRARLLAGHDAVLDAASDWIRIATLSARAAKIEQNAPAIAPPGAMPGAMPFAMPN